MKEMDEERGGLQKGRNGELGEWKQGRTVKGESESLELRAQDERK